MPRISRRQKHLKQLRHQLELEIILYSSDSDSVYDVSDAPEFPLGNDQPDDNTLTSRLSLSDMSDTSASSDDSDIECLSLAEKKPTELFELYFLMYHTRYWVDRHVSPKSDEFATQFFHSLPATLFRQLTRMDKSSFFNLLNMIESHPMFSNNSTFQQTPVVRQLAVCLDRLGHDGNGGCLNHLIPTWGVSTGTLVHFSQRCFEALEDALRHQIQWPTMAERGTISEAFGKLGFPGCVGLIDGSLLPLAQRPHMHGECYYDRKSRYSVNAQVVCDHRRKILYLFTGMAGSCSDLTCLRTSPMHAYCSSVGRNFMFEEDQYVIGDSGYQCLPHVVAAFKRADMVPDKVDFNTCLAKFRVTNEHCIGVLKSRWHSLKEIRVQLNAKKDNTWMVRWVLLCGKLHNYVLSQNDEWTEQDAADAAMGDEAVEGEGEAEPVDLGQVCRRAAVAVGNALLLRVMDVALEHHRQPGGFLYSA